MISGGVAPTLGRMSATASSGNSSLVLAVGQIDPVVGDFKGNIEKIREAYHRACLAGARVLVTPELSVCGYPPHDLVERPEIFSRNAAALEELKKLTLGQTTALMVGHIAPTPGTQGRRAQNCVSVLEQGKEVFRQAKTLLPTYDVFDEARYFEPASEVKLWSCDGVPLAVAICEDLWGSDPAWERQLYGTDPVERYLELGAKGVIAVAASPYEMGKRVRREEIHQAVARKLGAPLVYVNQTGATDEILFDGASFTLNAQGELTGRLKSFGVEEGVVKWNLANGSSDWVFPEASRREDLAPAEITVLHRGLVHGIREYFRRTGFERAVLGLSGGIDSAVVAALAVEALGRDYVTGVAMPSQYSSSHSLSDAEVLAENLGIAFEVKPIKFLFSAALREMSEGRSPLASVAQENLQSRLRGLTLLTISNHEGSLVLTTGNKSEIATGYCTLYGDMVGALAPLGDLMKTRVYELAHEINRKLGGVIPESTLTKAPSAELKPDQKDQDTLPPYEVLDGLLADYLERGVAIEELQRKWGQKNPGKGEEWVSDLLRKVELNEFKRRQAAPVLKVTPKAFGLGRRIPLAKKWDSST